MTTTPSTEVCHFCETVSFQPYIECIQCDERTIICTNCFSKGASFDQHQNNHHYTVVRDTFSLFNLSSWTAQEELLLLTLIGEYGYGNWNDIALKLQRNASDVEAHFNQFYVDQPLDSTYFYADRSGPLCQTPIRSMLCDDPPRPPEGSAHQRDLCGYMAARGDFTVEHDNYAEFEVSKLEVNDDDDELEKEAALAVLDIYRHVLMERRRRKLIVRKYGLINARLLPLQQRHIERALENKVNALRPLLRLIAPMLGDALLETLAMERDIRRDVIKLQEYRRAGLRHLQTIPVYETLRKRRHESKARKNTLEGVLNQLRDQRACAAWLQRQFVASEVERGGLVPVPSLPRRTAPPLDIQGLAGFEMLTEAERRLCESLRLVPQAYLSYKRVLVNESARSGTLKLAQARTLVKIDVNKTRKIFDYLCESGEVKKD